MEKKCSKCGVTKPLDLFVRDRHTISGYKSSCLKCNRQSSKQFDDTMQRKTNGIYQLWKEIKTRCLNPRYKQWKDYGGRGIAICDEWKIDFQTFYEWASRNGHAKGLDIDRIDNNAGYCPENCRFTTRRENNRNSRRAKLSMAIADQIRKLYATGTWFQKKLGEKFGVDQTQISMIIRGKSWA